jgi:hypothetical protein
MQGDAHSTNWAENQEFFLNQNNPTNFERTWNTAYYLYKRIGAVSDKTEFDQVMDFSVLQKLGKENSIRARRTSTTSISPLRLRRPFKASPTRSSPRPS